MAATGPQGTGERVARAIGAIAAGAGLFLIGRAAGLKTRREWIQLHRSLAWTCPGGEQDRRRSPEFVADGRGSQSLAAALCCTAVEVDMSGAPDQRLLDALLDSWDRNNAIMLNLLRALPKGGLEVKAIESSPPVAQQFMHIHHERLVSVFEEAPEFASPVPAEAWMVERDRDRIAQMLTDSAKAVRDAVRGRALAGRDLDLNYDHPILMLQLMLWHEGYHHGQIKLALKLAGRPISDDEAGPFTWDVWRGKRGG